jgi:predicted nucleotidyltransferase
MALLFPAPPRRRERIRRVAARIARRFSPERIVLFGSEARGTAGPHSDADFLVVMPFSGSRRERELSIRCAVHDIRIPKDIVVVTPSEMRRQRGIRGSIVREAWREGRTLYARGAWKEDNRPRMGREGRARPADV